MTTEHNEHHRLACSDKVLDKSFLVTRKAYAVPEPVLSAEIYILAHRRHNHVGCRSHLESPLAVNRVRGLNSPEFHRMSPGVTASGYLYVGNCTPVTTAGIFHPSRQGFGEFFVESRDVQVGRIDIPAEKELLHGWIAVVPEHAPVGVGVRTDEGDFPATLERKHSVILEEHN